MRLALPTTSVEHPRASGSMWRAALLGAGVGALMSGPAVGTAGGARPTATGIATAGGRLAAGQVLARAARTVYIQETAHLHLLSEGESTLNERGYASGTFGAPLTARLDLSPGHVSAVFTLYPKGGMITGRASARFIVRGSTGYYGGTMKIIRGTGSYRRAGGSNIGISGTINRYSFALTVKANGWMQL